MNCMSSRQKKLKNHDLANEYSIKFYSAQLNSTQCMKCCALFTVFIPFIWSVRARAFCRSCSVVVILSYAAANFESIQSPPFI